MEASDVPLSANSKAIVQCTDPDNLYERLEPRLAARSPLRNLHWKAPNRPLRSIPSLNIALTREDKSTGAQSSVRRHQIPGLRETPYVKVYLVRCDDKETYKEKVKKEVRQWVKTQTSSGDSKSSTKSQEGHDASEWLVLHVVLPNTPAASQPKSSKHISLEATESTDSVNSKSKWPGKSSSTIYDKLRADFSSSKSGIGRVAQVRLLEPGDKSTALTPAEVEEQWHDLVDSLKSCILRSFDARVAQYESDIRERDSQRHLPGWNFCTFFVLKEGLAKGFENLGLLEDGLAVYDELSLGLDALVKDQSRAEENDDSGALLTFSKDTKTLLRAALDSDGHRSRTTTSDNPFDIKDILTADRAHFPFDVDGKDYRHLILTNDVSALDLRIYLFTREIEILNRQAVSDSSKAHPSKHTANPGILASLIERSTQFISLAGRSLHTELYHAWGGHEGLSGNELAHQRNVIGNIVSTWQWRAVMQILSQTLPTLGLLAEHHTETLSLDALELSEEHDSDYEQSYDLDAGTRRMSLQPGLRSSSRERSQERNKRNSVMPNGSVSRHSMMSQPSYRQLALWVSKLILTARHIIESLETSKAFFTSLKRSAFEVAEAGQAPAVPNGVTSAGDEEHDSSKSEPLAGLDSITLRDAASSRQHLIALYTLLSVLAFRALHGTNNRATSRQILANLAEMEIFQGRNNLAARYLKSLLSPLPRFSYNPSEGHLLRMYAACLKTLDRPSEYTKCLISCLHHTRQLPHASQQTDQSYIDSLFQTLSTTPPMTLPASSLFHVSAVSRTISPLSDKDGFSVSVHLSCISGTTTPLIQTIKMRLVSTENADPRFIVLASREEVSVSGAGTTVSLESSVSTHGWYLPNELEVSIGNLRLLHHFKPDAEDESSRSENVLNPQSAVVPILVYPSSRNFAIKVYPFPSTHLAEVRRLLLQLRPGANSVTQCKLRLRTGTAGLRLNIHDSRLVGKAKPSAQFSTAREGDVWLMVVNDMAAESIIDIEIPYTMESASEPAVALRFEASYDTEHGSFTFHDLLTVKVILPVTVNVQDIARVDRMYSKFTITPLTMVPLRLINCKLEPTELYDVVTGGSFDLPLVIFPKQPANWTVCLKPQSAEAQRKGGRLTLVVDFQSLDGIIFALLETCFTREMIKTSHGYAARLLASHLVERIRTSWTEQDVEVAGLLQEFELWKFEDMDWPSVLCAFDRSARKTIEAWLREWHAQTPPLEFSSIKIPQRQLKLFVDVPPRPPLVSVCLNIQQGMITNHAAIVGQPLVAELVVGLEDQDQAAMQASFELVAPADSWLVGGRRKGNVQLTEQPARIPIVLFPRHLGHLLLPSINMRCRKRVQGTAVEEWNDVVCEIYNPGHARSILITPDLRSTSVAVFGTVPDEGTGRLIASEGRGGVG
jgi:trafficking protein particle complex subunit 10